MQRQGKFYIEFHKEVSKNKSFQPVFFNSLGKYFTKIKLWIICGEYLVCFVFSGKMNPNQQSGDRHLNQVKKVPYFNKFFKGSLNQ